MRDDRPHRKAHNLLTFTNLDYSLLQFVIKRYNLNLNLNLVFYGKFWEIFSIEPKPR